MNKTINSSDSNLEISKPETFSDPQKILGWHFSEDTKLGYNDNRPIIIGETLSVEGDIVPCRNGLHASENALDAFYYIPGKYLWRVELEGDLQSHGNPIDKWAGRHRKVLAGGDATEMLRKFGRDCALELLHLWPDAPPEEVKQFLETGVITESIKNYFTKNNSYKDFYYYANAAFYNAYNAVYNIYYVYDAIYYAAIALNNVPFKSHTSKFEKACLDFITEKS